MTNHTSNLQNNKNWLYEITRGYLIPRTAPQDTHFRTLNQTKVQLLILELLNRIELPDEQQMFPDNLNFTPETLHDMQ
jgi:hypothetical protein